MYVNIHFSQHHLWRDCYFSHWIVLEFLSNINWPQIYGFIAELSILCLCSMCLSYAITMIIILLWPCSKFWNLSFNSLKLVLFSRPFWLFGAPRNFTWIWGPVFQFMLKRFWDFDRACFESKDHTGESWHFTNMESFNPQTWDIFQFFKVFFSSLSNVF